MLRELICLVAGIVLYQGMMPAQTSVQATTSAYALGFSTYLSHTDRFFPSFDVVTDSKGYIYVSGNTADRNFPTTEGAFQRELKGEADAFVAKFAPDGKVVFATLVGGSKREHHTGLTVDDDGYIYLVGGTHSPDFPVTPGAYDTSFNGEGEWAGDVYVAKLDPTGSKVLFATFIGGKIEETAHSIKVDSKRNIVIGGATCSSDFPATEGAIHDKYTQQACFISKFSPGGDKLLFSASLGRGAEGNMVTGLAVDSGDNIYVTGITSTEDLPVTGNAIRKNLVKPDIASFENGMDHFLAKINGTGTKILYLSYLGDGGWAGTNITWASPNRLLVSGSTRAQSFPVRGNAVSEAGKGGRDGFFSIFNSDDMTLHYSTLVGGSQLDHIDGAWFLDEDRVAIEGLTNSADFPLTDNAMDAVYPASDKLFSSSFLGRRKAFVSVIDTKKGQVVYSTYMGACLRFKAFPDKSGNLGFIAETGPHGFPGTTDFPLSKGAFQPPPTFLMVGRLVLDGGPYLGQRLPGSVPSIFAPGVISKGNIHSRLVISPDGRTMLWNTFNLDAGTVQILCIRNVDGKWTDPQPPSFAKDGNTQSPMFAPDGKKLFFNVETEKGWCTKYVEMTDTGWSDPRNDGVLLDCSSSFTRSGSAYFSDTMRTKAWGTGIFTARYSENGYSDPKPLDGSINIPNAIDYTSFVSPDESFLLFSSNRPHIGDKEDMHIYVSFNLGKGVWSAPERVSDIPARFPSLSPDGKVLFFCGDDGNIYWVEATIIDSMRSLSNGAGKAK